MQDALYQLFLITNPCVCPAAELSRNYESPAIAPFACLTKQVKEATAKSLLNHILMEISRL